MNHGCWLLILPTPRVELAGRTAGCLDNTLWRKAAFRRKLTDTQVPIRPDSTTAKVSVWRHLSLMGLEAPGRRMIDIQGYKLLYFESKVIS